LASDRSSTTFYVHGSSESEQSRLTTLNSFLNDRCLRELNLNGGERILDIGCGLMQFTRAMARAAGRTVVGIERDRQQIDEALHQAREAGESDRVDLRAGDAYAFPLAEHEWGSFDFVHTRFLLEHVNDPARVVRQMVRAARPGGGRIVLADDDHDLLRLSPDVPELDDVWRAYVETYHAAGNDPFIGRRLVSLLHEAGLTPTRATYVFFGACAGEAIFPAVARNLRDVIAGARDAVLRGGAVDAARFDAAIAAITRWAERPDATVWYPLCWAEGVKM
jgi:SAM-dependent methyltransferase